ANAPGDAAFGGGFTEKFNDADSRRGPLGQTGKGVVRPKIRTLVLRAVVEEERDGASNVGSE
ncbi:MAG: hypothetical protein KDA46_09935, partial [Parvularculaceae bacterium]|nr:hypothetical protein [Parvularculaceae bacterium]